MPFQKGQVNYHRNESTAHHKGDGIHIPNARRLPLSTFSKVRQELSYIYKRYRKNFEDTEEITAEQARTSTYILVKIADLLKAYQLEFNVEALKKALTEHQGKLPPSFLEDQEKEDEEESKESPAN